VVLLGAPYQNQTQRALRAGGHRLGSAEYWVATHRHDLSAEDIAMKKRATAYTLSPMPKCRLAPRIAPWTGQSGKLALGYDRRHPKYFDLLPNFNPGKINEGDRTK
jgi:hypothetical protein